MHKKYWSQGEWVSRKVMILFIIISDPWQVEKFIKILTSELLLANSLRKNSAWFLVSSRFESFLKQNFFYLKNISVILSILFSIYLCFKIRDSPKVRASEASDGDDNGKIFFQGYICSHVFLQNGHIILTDSGDVEKKCQITKETNIEKVYQGKGSFILQDLYTNALYLIQHDSKVNLFSSLLLGNKLS